MLRGWAAASLLDTYEAERRPVAEHNVVRSLDPLGSRQSLDEGIVIDLDGRTPHRWVETAMGRVSVLDLIGPRLTELDDGTVVRPDGRVWVGDLVSI